VIPIIIRPCLWTETPFKNLQALPTDGVPVSTAANQDQAWLNVANGLLEVINQRLAKNQEVEEVAAIKPRPGLSKIGQHEDQIIKFLSAYKKYWFSPIKIKSMADKVAGTKDLTSLDVSEIIEHCESLTKKGLLSAMFNAKGNKVYKIN
jgi:hypothetical protein